MMTTCGCCRGIGPVTQPVTVNRPGLTEIVARVGTYSTFLENMLARLSELCLGDGELCKSGRGMYPLKALSTRDSGDPAIAMLHAFATVADVLTFYQERIANEGYLRTALERRSILELARLVGYRLRPGVSSTVYLAFELDKDFAGNIPAGARAQSTPDPGKLPQFFETGEPILGKGIWNAIPPRRGIPHWITYANVETITDLYFKGTRTDISVNSPVVFVFKSGVADTLYPIAVKVTSVETNEKDKYTHTGLALRQAARTARAADTVGELKKTIDKYLATDDFDISTASKMANRIISCLTTLNAGIDPAASAVVTHNLVAEILSSLVEEARTAEEKGYNKLRPWVDGLVEELSLHERTLKEAARDEAVISATPRPAATMPSSAATATAGAVGRRCGGQSSAPVALSRLLDVVGNLDLAPAAIPPHATALVRSPRMVYDVTADTVPKLLKVFTPRVESRLFDAWKRDKVPPKRSPLAPLSSVEVFRTKAVPFGSNAQPRQIYEEGTLVGTEEWPLTTAVFGLTLKLGKSIEAIPQPNAARFSINHDGQTDRKEIAIVVGDDPVKVPIGRFTATLALTIEDIGESGSGITGVRVTCPDLDAETYISIPVITTAGVRYDINAVSGGLAPGENRSSYSRPRDSTVYVHYSDNMDALSITVTLGPSALIDDQRNTLNNRIFLEGDIQGVEPGSWAVIERADMNLLVPRLIESVKSITMKGYGISGKSTQLNLAATPVGNWLFRNDTTLEALRKTTVYLQKGEPSVLTDIPLSGTIEGNKIELDSLYKDFTAGRWVTVTGVRTDTEIEESELMMVSAVAHGPHLLDVPGTAAQTELPDDTPHTTLYFAGEGLVNTYIRESVTVSANVSKATHGETREEVLGSGNAAQKNQTFALKQSPLTYLSAPTRDGAESTLAVRVDDILWHEAENFFDLGPTDRGFVTRIDNDDVPSVIFGNGDQGARPPSGAENIKAVYRFGLGRIGNVAAGKINQLAAKPLGIKGVINPLAATGGADRESRDQARRNAPMAAMSLDRLVSVQDYTDFTRTFAGIGKSSAVELSDGRREVVHVTIAGADDVPIETTSDLYRNLRKALLKYGDPYQPLQIETRRLKVLALKARVRIHPDYLYKNVQPEIVAALLDTFGFQNRELGEDALLGEIMAVFHTVPGVVYVDIDAFDGISEEDAQSAERLAVKLAELGGTPIADNGNAGTQSGMTLKRSRTSFADSSQAAASQPNSRVRADLAGYDGPDIKPAELAVFVPDLTETIILEEITG